MIRFSPQALASFSVPTGSAGSQANATGAGSSGFSQYVQGYDDLRNVFLDSNNRHYKEALRQNDRDRDGILTMDEFGEWHWMRSGEAEGRNLGGPPERQPGFNAGGGDPISQPPPGMTTQPSERPAIRNPLDQISNPPPSSGDPISAPQPGGGSNGLVQQPIVADQERPNEGDTVTQSPYRGSQSIPAMGIDIPFYGFGGQSALYEPATQYTPDERRNLAFDEFFQSPEGRYVMGERFAPTEGQRYDESQEYDILQRNNTRITPQEFTADPGYEFRRSEGIRALDSSAARRGALLSGNQLKELEQYGQGLAAQEYQNWFNRFNTEQNQSFQREAASYGDYYGRAAQENQTGFQRRSQTYNDYANRLASIAGMGAIQAQQAPNVSPFAGTSAFTGQMQAAGQLGTNLGNIYGNQWNNYAQAAGNFFGNQNVNNAIGGFVNNLFNPGQSQPQNQFGGDGQGFNFNYPSSF